MDLDDFDELDGMSTQVPRVNKFLPKSNLNKTVPKPEPPPPKPEPQPQDVSILKKPKSEENLTSSTLTAYLSPKIESSASNGAVKMEMKPLPDVKMEPKSEEPVDSDRNEFEEEEEDMIVREIDIYFNASIDADTQLLVMQYPLRACWRPYELDERCEELRLNPINAVVQLRPSIDQLKSGGLKRKKNVPSNAEVVVKLEDLNENESVGPSKKQVHQNILDYVMFLDELNGTKGFTWNTPFCLDQGLFSYFICPFFFGTSGWRVLLSKKEQMRKRVGFH